MRDPISKLAGTTCAAIVLAGCAARDVTDLRGAFGNGAEPALEAAEVERVLSEHGAEVDRLIAEAQRQYGSATPAEVQAALAGAPLPSVEVLAEARRALAAATLSDAERAAILTLLGPDAAARVTFHGRLVMQDDILHFADDLLSRGPLASERAEPERAARVDKANLPLTFVPDDPTGMVPGGPPRPNQIAKVENGQVLFWRADLGRPYFIVVPDDLPNIVFYGVVLAGYALERALPNDCIRPRAFTVMHASKYGTLPAMARALTSVVEVAYSTSACLDRADGCSNSPRLAELAITPRLSETRMRAGSYIGLETDFDSPRDSDTLPDLTDAKVRDVVLHELSHLIGFDHPRYTELRPELDTVVARVPQSSQGTVPTFMYPTEAPLYSSSASAEDQRVLRRTYGGSCAYVHDFRVLGDVCSVPSEQLCLRRGGSCEVVPAASDAGAPVERCRWHNFTDSESCGAYSPGVWETSHDAQPGTIFEGEAGACIIDTSALSSCLELSFMRTDEDSAGRCCSQFGTGDEGLLFKAFSDAEASYYFCSDQKGLGEPVSGSWEFVDAAEQDVFTTFDAVTGGSVPGWTVSAGDLVQELELPSHLVVSNRRLRSGCLSTEVTSSAGGESGIVFNFRNAQNYYVFDVIPNVRRRIRQVVNRVSTDLLVTPWEGPSAAPSVVLSVCFGDGIHTFIDENLSSRLSVDGPVSFVGTGGRIGLWNDMNPGARHAYLRSHSLVEGYALLH